MNELKTLKDLEEEYREENRDYQNQMLEGLGVFDDVKKEAIKWIKELEKEHFNHNKVDGSDFPIKPEKCDCWYDCDDSFYSFCMVNQKIKWIKHFFNITEEELK